MKRTAWIESPRRPVSLLPGVTDASSLLRPRTPPPLALCHRHPLRDFGARPQRLLPLAAYMRPWSSPCLPLFATPALPFLFLPRARRATSEHSGRSGDPRSSPTASRRALHHMEAVPPVNLELSRPRSGARLFFLGSGRIHPHRRRVFSSEPQLDSSLRKHPIAPLYLPLAQIGRAHV